MSQTTDLRDHAAIAAMQALLIRGWVGDDSASAPIPYMEDAGDDEDETAIGPTHLAHDAYRIADAMLLARTERDCGKEKE